MATAKKQAAPRKRARTTKRAPRRADAAGVRQRLRRYHAKRELARSGEPDERADDGASAPAALRYVIQKHDATRLHYDFRLEMEGVFRSWAVPKGLPEKPGDKALAVEVEDHPLAYGSFEGTIPEGNYGAGTVMLWDRGSYIASGGEPARAFRAGKIHFALLGDKCRGEWTLLRMRTRDAGKTNWLLLKNHEARRGAPIKRTGRERSVVSGRTLDEIARDRRSRVWRSNRAESGR